ncbi:putative calcium-transporting ATPase 11, plasma membrane-type [Neltuma alba]|uniref:putative calcium-transporting ATPase 11, plasma membrane-type n=1 Tax=Neltuma alba TaxID=207710 RepID=UPI0010A48322|nr:putative calcium-transporting ATPase 11, plasma membrane-type [Prosopis alba]
MEQYLRENFDVSPKRPSEANLRRWRSAVSIVKNPRRRFRMVADLAKRAEAEKKRKKLQEKVRVALYVQKAALQFIDAGQRGSSMLSREVKESGFAIEPDDLANICRSHNSKGLEHSGGVAGLAKAVNVSLEDGVRSSDVPHRQNVFGSNRFAEKPSRGFWMFVWDAMQDLTLIILLLCAFVSIGVGIPTEGWPKGVYDGVGIALSILLVVFVTSVSDYKQSLQFKDLENEKKNVTIQVIRDRNRQKISIYELVVGDIVHLSIGDIVPADGLFISGYNLLVDESSLSGESEAVHVDQRAPFLLAGTKVQDGSAKMLVTSVGMRTEWGRLMDTLNEVGDDETPLQVKLNGVATIIGKIGLGFALMTFLVLTGRFLVRKIVHNEISQWSLNDASELLNFFATAVIIIVVAVPEGLPLAVTLSLAFAMKKLMNDKALVRHLSACETMGSAGSICTDKTGTLTTNHMVVHKIWICGQTKEMRNNSSENLLKSSISEQIFDLFLQSIFQNTGSEVVKGENGKNKVMGTPTEKALLEFGLLSGGEPGVYNEKYKILKIEPFNSNRKRMSVLVALPGTANKSRAFCKGASEIVLEMCDKLVDTNGKVVRLFEEQRRNIAKVINDFASEALRTLSIAFKDIEGNSGGDNIPEENFTLLAIVGIKDPVRPGVKKAVETCKAAGISVKMVTGDNIITAKAIARECGILTDGIAIEGPEFRKKTQQEMEEIIPKIQVMARSLPLDKHTLVTHLRTDFDEVVAVTGDGTNDAPALREADIGLAMGIAGTEVAKENADVIVMDDNFTTILNVARWGRSVYINVQKFVQFQLTVNVVALILNFVSACVSGSAPLTAVQMLWVNMIMDTLGALALATEPPHDGLMKRPPVGRNANLITGIMWRNIIGQSLYQIAVLLVLKFRGEQIMKLNGPDATSVLNTFIFNVFVFCQVFNEINSRDMEKINVFRGIFSSWIFLGVLASTICFQAILVEFLGTFAQTVPLSWDLWLASVLIGSVSLPLAAIVKCIPVPVAGFVDHHHHHDYVPIPSGPDMA